MKKLIIKVISPYKATLYIDENIYYPNETNEYIIELNPIVEHTLQIVLKDSLSNHFVEVKDLYNTISFSNKSIINKKHSRKTRDLVYKSVLSFSKSANKAKLIFKYENNSAYSKSFLVNLLNRDVPYIKIEQSVGIVSVGTNIYFENKNEIYKYIFNNRIVESILFLISSCFCSFILAKGISDYFDGIKMYTEYIRYVSSPKDRIIISVIQLFIVLVWFLFDNYIFFSHIKKMIKVQNGNI